MNDGCRPDVELKKKWDLAVKVCKDFAILEQKQHWWLNDPHHFDDVRSNYFTSWSLKLEF